MIRINLLPADLRRGTRLPAKVLAVAFGAALAVSASIGWFGLVWFGDLGNAEHRLEAAVGKLAERQKKLEYVDQLEANKKDYSARVQTIQDIAKSRRVWTKFLDELIDVVNNNGDVERHLVWFDDIVVRNDAKKGATVAMKTSVQGPEQSRLANFDDDLAAAPFGKDVTRSDLSWKLKTDDARVPPQSLFYALQLQFQPTVKEAPKARPAPQPAAAPSK
jgi:Tfp pilus assembly protein PilN